MNPATVPVRAVLDTNVFLSGLLFGGGPAHIVSRGLAGDFTIVCSLPIVAELREKLETSFDWPSEEVERLLRAIIPAMEVVDVPGTLRAVSKDPDDNPIIETALVGGASYVVTGDKHLLQIGTYHGVAIVTVVSFRARLGRGRMNP